MAQGVDLVSFSGDKLLGGVQAGIIVGKKEWIDRLQAHPLKRVLRCDKVSLAGLEATLRLYLQPEKLTQTLPTFSLLTQSVEELERKAGVLKARLAPRLSDYRLAIAESFAQIGSGAQPSTVLPSVAVTIMSETQEKLTALLSRFKSLPQPIIGRIEKNRIWLDLRSVANFECLLDTLENL